MTTSPDDLVYAMAHHVATRFASTAAQASAVLMVAASAAVSDDDPPGGVPLWMSVFDAAALLLRTERARLLLPPGGDPLLRDLQPYAHLLDIARINRPRALGQ